jgi:hypothetical protein
LDHPLNAPVPRPIVKYSVRTFCAKTLSTKHAAARKDPAMVTARQPYLFTNELEMGPAKQQTRYAILEKGKTPSILSPDHNLYLTNQVRQ